MSSLLVLGGARSGKSTFAQVWAEERSATRTYLATAWSDPADAEMQTRIARHRADRAARAWTTVEVGADLAGSIAAVPAGVALVDCITLWLSGRCLAHDWNEAAILADIDGVCAAVRAATVDVALVSNEVGSGVVPEHAWGRAFRDLQGWANQRLARAADRVVLCVAGLPVEVKPCAR